MHWLIEALVSLRRPLSEGNAALLNNPRRKPPPPPLNPLNLLNPMNPHTEGVSKGAPSSRAGGCAGMGVRGEPLR